MTSPLNPTRVRSEEPPLIAMINHHRDDVAINLKAVTLAPENRALFPILVAIARLTAKSDVASEHAASQLF